MVELAQVLLDNDLSVLRINTRGHDGVSTATTNDQGEYISYWMQAPNLDLEPEKLRSVELNYSRSWDRGALSLSGYYSQVDNLITSEPNAPMKNANGHPKKLKLSSRAK